MPDILHAVVTEYQYDAWGNIISTTGTLASTVGTINPFRYRSYYYATDSGLYYLQSRYYDPVVKRFVNGDCYTSTGQGFVGNNMFAYCNNNPVMFVDSDGTMIREALAFIGIYGTFLIPFRLLVGHGATFIDIIGFRSFLNALSISESSGNYKAKNEYGYLGRYQMGNLSLQEAELMDSSGSWTSYANGLGIFCEDDFLNSKPVQNLAIAKAMAKSWSYIVSYGLDKYIGKTKFNVTITESGLLAAAHLIGAKGLKDALKNNNDTADANGTTVSKYLSLYAGYNIKLVKKWR
ncbi:MAG: RHS repeat-associated core domain-containing protein [Oscillospiraceae bacterium]